MIKIKDKTGKEHEIPEDSTLVDLIDDVGKYHALDALSNSKGGQILIKSATKEVVSKIDHFTNNFSTMTMQEFVSLGAELKKSLELLRILTRAGKNKVNLDNELEQALHD